jgi:hypothetical protein
MTNGWRAASALAALIGLIVLAPAAASAQGTLMCKPVVVHCNYAAHYSGTVDYTNRLDGPSYHRVESVSVTFQKGVAMCSGSVTETDASGTKTGTIGGPGLIAVEFDQDSDVGKYYEVTAACPSAAGMGSPVTPPELDGREYKSYKQPSTLKPGDALSGTTTSHPDDDPVNGARSTVQVSWNIK